MLNHCVYVKYDAPVEKTNPLHLASGCSNQIGPEKRPPLKFNFVEGFFSGPNWLEQPFVVSIGTLILTFV